MTLKRIFKILISGTITAISVVLVIFFIVFGLMIVNQKLEIFMFINSAVWCLVGTLIALNLEKFSEFICNKIGGEE